MIAQSLSRSEHRQSRRQGLETQARNMMTNRDIRDVPVTQQLLGYHGNKSLNLHKNKGKCV
jgi:hypothetical protein